MFLAAGATLDKYEIIAPLAVGGMAELYVARVRGPSGFDRVCVIKRILPQHARDDAFVRMFLDEARLAATLHHPNVIQVHDVGVVKGRYYFAMEYVHGQDLGAVVAAARGRRRGLRVGNAVAIAIGVAAGLHHAHTQTGADGQPLGIVHRDVSPANILISYDGHVKVVDFGIAKAAARATQTTAGGIKGKLSYMSPEQVHARKDLDRRSDVFSLGVVLYELTTGKPLFRGESDYLIAEQITRGEIVPPGEARPGYDEHLATIVMKALALDPADRWSTAGELADALETYARSAQLGISSASLAEVMRDLFAVQIAEWEAARDRGQSLVDVVRNTAEMAAVRLTDVGADDGADGVREGSVSLGGMDAGARDADVVTPSPRAWRRPSVWIATAAIAAAIAGWAIVLARGDRGEAAERREPGVTPPSPTAAPASTPMTRDPATAVPAGEDVPPIVPPIDDAVAEANPPSGVDEATRRAAERRRRRRDAPGEATGSAAGSGAGSTRVPLDQVTNPFGGQP